MSKGSGTTRGDRRRNARRERLREMLPRDGAVIGIDLAEDKQAIAVVDHDVRVLARKTVRVPAFRLGEALDWAVGQARGRMVSWQRGAGRGGTSLIRLGLCEVGRVATDKLILLGNQDWRYRRPDCLSGPTAAQSGCG